MPRAETAEVDPYDLYEPPPADKRVRVRLQTEQCVAGQRISCYCGQEMFHEMAYKCLYCGEWYCTKCAEGHFGMTRKRYRELHPLPPESADLPAPVQVAPGVPAWVKKQMAANPKRRRKALPAK